MTTALDGKHAKPLGRSGRTRDIAQIASFLASDASRFVTGTHLAVDGGITIGPRHTWDPQTPGPLQRALGISHEQAVHIRSAALRGSD